MKVKISTHAQIRMFERGIDAENVRLTVKYPLLSIPQKDGSMEHQREFEGKIIGVISKQVDKNTILIITAYYI